MSVSSKLGSPSLSVLHRQVKRQHPGAWKFGPCSTVHDAFVGLQTIDLPLGLAVAPILYQRVYDGIEISPHRSSEALHCVDAGLLRVIEPDAEFLNVFASENAPEMAMKSAEAFFRASTFAA
jgi:hypothetical protein